MALIEEANHNDSILACNRIGCWPFESIQTADNHTSVHGSWPSCISLAVIIVHQIRWLTLMHFWILGSWPSCNYSFMQLTIINQFRATDHYESIQADTIMHHCRAADRHKSIQAADQHAPIMQLTTCTLYNVGQLTIMCQLCSWPHVHCTMYTVKKF